MKKDIILAGVGGQGILTIAAVIGIAASKEKLHVKQSEVHGMSQRGGAVQSHLRISSNDIASELIPKGKADLILATEPMEGLRYLEYLSREGTLISNSTPFINIGNYPPKEKLYEAILQVKHHLLIDAESLAREAGSLRAVNMVLLGAAFPYLNIAEKTVLESMDSIFRHITEKDKEKNRIAFQKGKEQASKQLNTATA